mmetsp:Transcript_24222/g.80515  ORF Transcript_24222/g.80515 Transcript_24222/m.80515 type:complete len:303 (-) Transcript_24222:42-950(-)
MRRDREMHRSCTNKPSARLARLAPRLVQLCACRDTERPASPGGNPHNASQQPPLRLRAGDVRPRGPIDVRRKRRHHLAAVRRDLAGEGGDGARHLGLGDEGHDAEHREAAVVELGEEALLLLLRGRALAPLEGVVQVEANPVRQLVGRRVEVGHVAGLAALHVVRRAVHPDLRPPLQEADPEDDLPLCGVWELVPLLGRAGRRDGVERGPRELDPVGLDDEADEPRHRDAAMLDLGVPQPADGLLVGVVPKLRLAQLQRIPVADDGVEAGREGLEVRERLHAHGTAADSRRRRRGSDVGERQ